MKKEYEKIISRLVEAALDMTADHEELMDVTSYGMTVKRPGTGPYYIRGEFVNLFCDKAFNKTDPDNAIAIEAIKNQLWYSFYKCYNRDIK
jgi:hypothetical protein